VQLNHLKIVLKVAGKSAKALHSLSKSALHSPVDGTPVVVVNTGNNACHLCKRGILENSMYKKVSNFGIAVKVIEECLKFYRDLLGLELEGQHAVEEQKVITAFLLVGETPSNCSTH
jgi:hypothetical protein